MSPPVRPAQRRPGLGWPSEPTADTRRPSTGDTGPRPAGGGSYGHHGAGRWPHDRHVAAPARPLYGHWVATVARREGSRLERPSIAATACQPHAAHLGMKRHAAPGGVGLQLLAGAGPRVDHGHAVHLPHVVHQRLGRLVQPDAVEQREDRQPEPRPPRSVRAGHGVAALVVAAGCPPGRGDLLARRRGRRAGAVPRRRAAAATSRWILVQNPGTIIAPWVAETRRK